MMQLITAMEKAILAYDFEGAASLTDTLSRHLKHTGGPAPTGTSPSSRPNE